MRVELRRVEAVARLFGETPAPGAGAPARDAAREVRRRLSALRSEEACRALLASRPGEEAARAGPLVFPGTLPRTRVDAADLARVSRILSTWRRRLAATFDGAFAPRAAGEALLARRTRRRLRKRLGELAGLLPPGRKDLHAARISAKRARYALEAVEPLAPGLRPLLRLLRSFQDAAGDAHDLAELAARVREAAGTTGDGASLLAGLATDLEAEAARAFSAARRRGKVLDRSVRRQRPTLAGADSR